MSSISSWGKIFGLLNFLTKNWPNNTFVNVENDEGLGDEDKFGVQAKKGVLDILDMEFPNEVEDHVKKMCRIKTCMDMILDIATCHFIIYINSYSITLILISHFYGSACYTYMVCKNIS